MPRNQTRRVNRNVAGETNIRRGAPRPVATPVDRTVVPGAGVLQELNDAIKAGMPGATAFLQAKHKKFVESELLKGTQAAIGTAPDSQQEALQTLKAAESPWFQQAYMRQAGINMGMRRARQMEADLNDPTKFDPVNGDINAFVAQHLAEDLQGVDDPDFQKGYLTVVREAEQKVRNAAMQARAKALRADVQDKVYEAAYNTLERAIQAGATGPEVFRELEQSIEGLGLTKQELNGIYFAAASTLALEGDGHPEVIEMFKHRGVNGPASLYFTKDYGSRLRAVEAQALNRKKAVEAQKNTEAFVNMLEAAKTGQQTFETEQVFDLVRAGKLTVPQANQILAAQERRKDEQQALYEDSLMLAVYNGMKADPAAYTDEYISSLGLSPDKQLALRKQRDSMMQSQGPSLAARSALLSGTGPLVLGAKVGDHQLSTKDLQASMDSLWFDTLQQTQGDFAAATRRMLPLVIENGLAPKAWSEVLSQANPENEKTWTLATALYDTLNQQHFTAFSTLFTNERARTTLDTYDTLRSVMGLSHEDATAALRGMAPTTLEAAKLQLGEGSVSQMLREVAKAQFAKAGGLFGIGGDAVQNWRVLDREFRDAMAAVLATGVAPEATEDLAEKVAKRVKERYVRIGNRWVRKEASTILSHPDFGDAAEAILPLWAKEVKGKHAEALGPLSVITDPRRRVDARYLTVVDQWGVPVGTIDGEKMVQRYKVTQMALEELPKALETYKAKGDTAKAAKVRALLERAKRYDVTPEEVVPYLRDALPWYKRALLRLDNLFGGNSQ